MPTALPIQTPHAAAVQRLSWPDLARFVILLLRVRWLDRRLHVAYRRVDRLGLNVAGPNLLRHAYRWLDVYQQIGALLGIPEPPHVAQVRATLQKHASNSAEK